MPLAPARWIALAVALGAAFAAGATLPTAAFADEEGCSAFASRTWSAQGQPELTVEALADGPTCGQAVALLAVRDADGAPLWARAFLAADNFVLRDAATEKAMQAALERWLDPQEVRLDSTAALPEWAADADLPGGEFPFRPSEIFAGREDYEALRAADRPLLCVVAGGESILCAVFEDGRIDEVGVQSFPG